MRKRTPLVASLLTITLAVSAALAGENTAKKPGGAGKPAQDEMMAAYMKLATPGENHNYLKPLAGSWKTTVKSWQGPDQMEVTEGDCESTWVMGGRYLKEECNGNMGGMPFSGMGLSGYDNATKKYVGSWVDTMGTGILNWEGAIDPSHKVLTSQATMMDPASGKPAKMKMVTKITDENRHTFSMYGYHDGKEALEMEITYVRK